MGARGDTMISGLDPDLLEILCCPITRQPLHLASPEELARANSGLEDPLEEGLVREDGKLLYPIRAGIPLLIPEEGCRLT